MTTTSNSSAKEELCHKISRYISNICLALSGFSLVMIIIISFADIVARYFLTSAILQKTELVQILLTLSFAFALPVICFNREHIDVDLLDGMFNKQMFNLRRFLVDFSVFGSLAIMSYWLFFKAERIARNKEIYDELHFNMAPVAYILSTLITLCALAVILRIIFDIVDMYKKNDLKQES